MKVVVLGASGMLGAMVVDVLERCRDLDVIGTVRSAEARGQLAAVLGNVEWKFLDAERTDVSGIEEAIGDASWVINAIGVIKPYIHDDNANEVERAIWVNSLFPHLLARVAEEKDFRVIQIATDCVYSGKQGGYLESDVHDALDAYGKTKSLGEVHSLQVSHLRCSIIGPEPKAHVSLLDWFLSQERGAEINGFTNHEWNGVTTLHFARLCMGVIQRNISLRHLQHVLAGDRVTKCEMVQEFARNYNRTDIKVNPTEATVKIDRTLATNDSDLNVSLWEAAGYAEPPSVGKMIEEMAKFDCRFA